MACALRGVKGLAKGGRPRNSWQRGLLDDMKSMGYMWGELGKKAKDWIKKWRHIINSL
jgi:hypothetical protein